MAATPTQFQIHLTVCGMELRFVFFFECLLIGFIMLIHSIVAYLLPIPLDIPSHFECMAWYYLVIHLIGIVMPLPLIDMFGKRECCRTEIFISKLCRNYGTLCSFLFSCVNAMLVYFIIAVAKGNLCGVLAISGVCLMAQSYLVMAANPRDSSSISLGSMANSIVASFMFYGAGFPLIAVVAISHGLLAALTLCSNAMDFKARKFLRDALTVESVWLEVPHSILSTREFCEGLLKYSKGD